MATVYVWLPGKPQQTSYFHGISGHISLEANSEYFSFWPGRKRGGKENIGLVHPTPADFARSSVQQDIGDMGYEVDITTSLYGLNEQAISNEWERIKRDATKYKLVETNCCTVTGRLLHVGFMNTQVGKDALAGRTGKYLRSMLEGTVDASVTRAPNFPPTVTPTVILFFAELINDALAGYPLGEDKIFQKVRSQRDEISPNQAGIGKFFQWLRDTFS